MAESRDFQKKQYAFAAHIRDPDNVPAPAGIEDRRMAIYRRLFFNNLRNLLSSTFPVLRKIHGDAQWKELVRSFMIHHRAETPYFLEIPSEFLAFLESEQGVALSAYPFVAELAHYEWIELELSVSTEQNDLSLVDAGGDLLLGHPVKSVLAQLLAYQYPVQHISQHFLPEAPPEQPTYLCVYRQQDDELGFMEMNPISARLLQLIEESAGGRSGRDLLEQLARETGHDAEALAPHGLQAMSEMLDKEILLGTKSPAA